jgi:hypothetical protein
MALAKNVNSYVTVAEADAYFADRLDSSSWSSADATDKAKALISASAQLDRMNYGGVAVSTTQKLAFPRRIRYLDPVQGCYVDMSEIPQRFLNAVFEQALHLLSNEGMLSDSGTVQSISIDVIQLDTIRPVSQLASITNSLIRPLLQNNGSRSWWRAN